MVGDVKSVDSQIAALRPPLPLDAPAFDLSPPEPFVKKNRNVTNEISHVQSKSELTWIESPVQTKSDFSNNQAIGNNLIEESSAYDKLLFWLQIDLPAFPLSSDAYNSEK